MRDLQVFLLGTPEVRWANQVLPVKRRYPRVLLFYLASQGSMVGRDELLATFWEDENEKTARLRLRETLNKLRSALPNPDLLLSQDDRVGLDFKHVWVDQLNFESLSETYLKKASRVPPQDALPEVIQQKLKEAVGLWRGSRFLPGVNFPSTILLDEWLSRTSQRVEYLRSLTLQRLSDHAFVTENLDDSLHLARLCLENDELNEDLHERILQILIRMGRRSEAREHFKHLLDLTRRELGQRPSSRLFALYKLTRAPHTHTPPPSTQILQVKPSIQSPFVGRQLCMTQLNETHQYGGAVFILGESGLGKTRLLQEFFTQMQPKARLLLAGCRPYETNLPFQPIIDIARNSIHPEEWVNFPIAWITNLLPLMPDLADLRPEADKALELVPDHGRSVLFEAIRQIMAQIASRERLVVCIDDAHWADEATLSAIAYLLERPPFPDKAILIMAARIEQVNSNLESLIRFTEERGQGVRVNLPRLTKPDVQQLVSAVLGSPPADEFSSQLVSESGGNPFFIIETLRTILERGANLDLATTTSFPLPRNMYLLIRGRLTNLSTPARSVLEVAAAIGTEFYPELIAKAGEFPEKEICEALWELEEHQLVERLPFGRGDLAYRFIHDKIRETLLLEINPVKLRWLHRQVAHGMEALLQEDVTRQAGVLAYHHQAAGDWSRAFDYWIIAGQRARELLSVEEAIQAFRKAEALLHQNGCHLSDEQIHRLFFERNELKFDTHNSAALKEQNEILLKIGDERNSPLLLGTALLGLGNVCMINDQYEEGIGYATQAIQLLDTTNNLSQRVQAYTDRGVLKYMFSRWKEAKIDFEEALKLAKDHQQPDIMSAGANAHYNMAVINHLEGKPARARYHAYLAIRELPLQGRTYRQVPGYNALALAQLNMGDYNDARISLQTGIELAEKTHSWRMLSYLHGNRALFAQNTGNLGLAITSAQKMMDSGEQFGHKEVIALGNRMIGDIYFLLQAPEMAQYFYQNAIDAGEKSFIGPDLQFRLGHVLCQLGKVDQGMNYLQKSLRASKEAGLGLVHILTRLSLARVLTTQGQWEHAEKIIIHLEKDTRRRSLATQHLHSTNLLGECALHMNDISAAIKHFKAAARRAATLPNPWIELKSQIMLSYLVQSFENSNREAEEKVTFILETMESSLPEGEEYQVLGQCFQQFRNTVLDGKLDI